MLQIKTHILEAIPTVYFSAAAISVQDEPETDEGFEEKVKHYY